MEKFFVSWLVYDAIAQIDEPAGFQSEKHLSWIFLREKHMFQRIFVKIRQFVSVFLRQNEPFFRNVVRIRQVSAIFGIGVVLDDVRWWKQSFRNRFS